MCGDFNSRTGQAPDYESGVTDINANVPSERSNEDIVSNKYGQLSLNLRKCCVPPPRDLILTLYVTCSTVC